MLPKVFFPNLNGVRFIAACTILFYHVEQFKSIYGLHNIWNTQSIMLTGKLGVTLFFVLSGFLITYLLMKEKTETKTIHIKKFYVRRLLRIWPLYYLTVCIGFFIIPQFHFFFMPVSSDTLYSSYLIKLFLFLIFLPNLALAVFPSVPFISQTWSVGVEEQFYFIWPILMKKCNNILHMLIGVLIFYYIILGGLYFFHTLFPDNFYAHVVYEFWTTFSMDSLCYGGIAAYILFMYKQKLLNLLFQKYLQIGIYILIPVLIYFGVSFYAFTNTVYAILFSVLIINLAGNIKTGVNLQNILLNYGGKISYGIYMLHPIGILLAMKIAGLLNTNSNILLYITSVVISVSLAAFSYEVFEKQFLKLKKKYAVIISGDAVEK